MRLAGERLRFASLLAVVLIIAGLLIGNWIGRGISRPLRQILDLLGSVAQGDLSRRVEITTKDEVGQMSASLNEALASLSAALQRIRASAQELARYGQDSNAISGSPTESVGGIPIVVTDSSASCRRL